MGGRGSAGSRVSAKQKTQNEKRIGLIGKEKPIEVTVIRTDDEFWKTTVLDALNDGNLIYLQKRRADKIEKQPDGTYKATYSRLQAGMYVDSKTGKTVSHNINWENVYSVAGKTYDVKEFIKEQGFGWDGDRRRFRRLKKR